MAKRLPFDEFADIYQVWVASASAVTDANRRFYVEEYLRAGSPVVELGIGDGRIAVEAAKEGVDVIGVDSAPKMLALCRRRFEKEGVLERLRLIEADFRDFELDEPAPFAAIPFHTIGVLTSLDAKREALCHIHEQLAPGGKLVFDHFVFNETYARQRNRTPELRAEFQSEETGRDVLLWSSVSYDFPRKQIRIVAWTDEIDAEGVALERRYRRVDFSWIDPEDTRRLLEEAEFEVEALWGSFDRTPFGEDSPHQIWVARKKG